MDVDGIVDRSIHRVTRNGRSMSVSLEAVGRAVHFSGLGKEVSEKREKKQRQKYIEERQMPVPCRSLETRAVLLCIRTLLVRHVCRYSGYLSTI